MDNPFAPYELQFSNAERKELIYKQMELLRMQNGYSQKKVAELLGIPVQTYNGYEKGRNEPPIECLVRLSFLYKVPMDTITQRDNFYKTNSEALKKVKQYNEEIKILKEQFPESKYADNKILTSLLSTIDKMSQAAETALEKSPDKLEKNKG